MGAEYRNESIGVQKIIRATGEKATQGGTPLNAVLFTSVFCDDYRS